jgi:hypothetical protein
VASVHSFWGSEFIIKKLDYQLIWTTRISSHDSWNTVKHHFETTEMSLHDNWNIMYYHFVRDEMSLDDECLTSFCDSWNFDTRQLKYSLTLFLQ